MAVDSNCFYEEAVELLTALECNLLDLEKNSANPELVNDVFRALHTLKGSGSMFGFTELARFVHNIENAFDLLRKNEIELTPELINLTLQARDLMALLIVPNCSLSKVDTARIAEMSHAFSLFTSTDSAKKSVKSDVRPLKPEALASAQIADKASVKPLQKWEISFAPFPDFFASGNSPLLIIEELSALGDCSVNPIVDGIPDLEHINPEICYLAWQITLLSACDENAIRDVFMFAEDICELTIELAKDQGDYAADNIAQAKNDALPQKSEQLPETHEEQAKTNAVVNTIKTFSDQLSAGKIALPSDSQTDSTDSNSVAGIRVDSNKLDRLISLLGELVTIQARLAQVAESRGDTEIITIVQELDILTGELRDNALKLSMLPISSIFPRLERFAANTGKLKSKQVCLKFDGGDTELDKAVLNKLFEPLTRLIGYCIGQGLESGCEISLSAWHSSGNVCICVEDNGLGASPSDHENNELLKTKKSVEELRGIFDSRISSTRGASFTIRLPLNLAIIEGLMVRIEDVLFVFPLSLVEECIELTVADQQKNYNKNVVMVRGQIVPFINLRESFAVAGNPPPIQQVVIININQKRVGFAVDKVVGEYQTVIKSWGKFCGQIPGIAGATILGDGSIALIVDLPELIKEEQNTLLAEGEL